MSLIAPQSKSKGFEAGVYDAVCYSVLDIGTQENKFGKKHQIVLGWKFQEYTYEDGNNVSYHQTFTFSMNEKAKLRELLGGWVLSKEANPEAYDLTKLLGLGCKLVLAPNANGTVSGKTAIPHEVEMPVTTETFSFADWDGGDLPKFLYEDRNKWKLDRIQGSDEYIAQKEENEDKANDQMVATNEEAPF